MASGNFTTGSLTPSIAQLAACGSTSNVVSGGHQFEGREKMASYKRARTDYPGGVIAIYDNGGKTADRYTVVYAPADYNGLLWYPYVGMSGEPFHPQGFCQHGEARHHDRPRATYGGQGCGKVIRFEDLPPDCQAVVMRDTA